MIFFFNAGPHCPKKKEEKRKEKERKEKMKKRACNPQIKPAIQSINKTTEKG